MVDIKDIRVGVTLYNKTLKKEVKVTKENVSLIIRTHYRDEYEGVKITEKRLLDEGFKMVEHFKSRSANYREYQFKELKGKILYCTIAMNFSFDFHFNRLVREIKYLHHVQNLMYNINKTE